MLVASAYIKKILGDPLSKVLVGFFAVVGFWDTLVAQFLPPELAEKMPNLYRALEMTSGHLPFWGWLLIGAFIFVFLTLDYAYRKTEQNNKKAPKWFTTIFFIAIVAFVIGVIKSDVDFRWGSAHWPDEGKLEPSLSVRLLPGIKLDNNPSKNKKI